MASLMEEYFYFNAHKEEIVKDHLGEYVAIKGTKVLGYYEDWATAFQDMAAREIEAGTFALRKCLPMGESDDISVASVWTR
jgi:hypothetical protein